MEDSKKQEKKQPLTDNQLSRVVGGVQSLPDNGSEEGKLLFTGVEYLCHNCYRKWEDRAKANACPYCGSTKIKPV